MNSFSYCVLTTSSSFKMSSVTVFERYSLSEYKSITFILPRSTTKGLKLFIGLLSSGIVERNHIENILPSIVMPGYIVNSDLPYIYNNAFAFLYTSLRESFGIPLLEAMACGTPVITSNTSSMPEIGGKEAILINPENPNEMTEKMLQLENDQAFYDQQKKIGLERAQLFSWRETAEQLLTVYDSVYKKNNLVK